MDFALGVKSIFYIKIGNDYFPVGCLNEESFDEDLSTIGSTTRDNSGGWNTARGTNQGYSISINGIVPLSDNNGTRITFAQLRNFKRMRTQIDWRIYSEDLVETEEGKGLITSLSKSAPVDGFVTFSAGILGIGEPSSTNAPPVVVRKWIEIGDSWVYKGTNTNENAIEVGDRIRRYPSASRYIHALVNALPHTSDANLTFFEDITVI